DADGEDGNRDGGGNSETGAEANVNRDRAEEESEEGTEDDGADGELGERFVGRDVGAKFVRRGRGTPGTIGHKSSIRNARDGKGAGGLCRRTGAGGSGFASVYALGPGVTCTDSLALRSLDSR